METRPRPLIERLVGALIPAASREHVLGDLYQRHTSDSRYVLDACRVVPHVVWSQIRRTANPTLLVAEFVLVYLAFASAALSVTGFFSQPLVLYQLALPATLVLLTLVLRDAYAGANRSSSELAADAMLAVVTVLAADRLLSLTFDRLALPRAVLIGGSVASLLVLSAIRTVAFKRSPRSQQDGTAPSQSPIGPQKDLHRWWWITAVLGVVVWATLFFLPMVRPLRPLLIAWLLVFLTIGIYQRRKIHWPARMDASVGGDQAYRDALARQRDAQRKWPFRRLPLLIVVHVPLALLLGLDVMQRGLVPTMSLALAAYVIPATGWLLCGWLLTNRAARDFDRELALIEPGGVPRDEPQR